MNYFLFLLFFPNFGANLEKHPIQPTYKDNQLLRV